MLSIIDIDIQKRKPEISKTTRMQHARTIYKIYRTLWPTDEEFLPDRIINSPTDTLMSVVSPTTGLDNRKRFASALGIYTKRPELSNIVTHANLQYQTRIANHIPSERDVNNKITEEDIIQLDNQLKYDYETNRCPKTIQQWLLWCLVSGKYIPPRRNLDWIQFKVRNIDQDKDNFLDETSRTIICNRYKTQHIYGQDCIRIPDVLYDLIQEYAATHPYEYLFTNTKGNQLTNCSFNEMVNRLSNSTKGKGTNQFRKAYLQSHFGNLIHLEDTMRSMGSSSNRVFCYISNV